MGATSPMGVFLPALVQEGSAYPLRHPAMLPDEEAIHVGVVLSTMACQVLGRTSRLIMHHSISAVTKVRSYCAHPRHLFGRLASTRESENRTAPQPRKSVKPPFHVNVRGAMESLCDLPSCQDCRARGSTVLSLVLPSLPSEVW